MQEAAKQGALRTPVLLTDDDSITRMLLGKMLENAGYEVIHAENGREAIDILEKRHIHLLVTDWMMPEVNGLELCQWVSTRRATREMFILMITSRGDGHDVMEALSAGADEFIRKPIHPEELMARLRSAERKMGLFSRDVTIYALAQLAESRDSATGDHLARIREYVRVLTEAYMSGCPHEELPPDFSDLLYMTSPMHDIGKVGIPDAILLKAGPLTDPEFTVMKTHTTIGANTLNRALQEFPSVVYLQTARDIALTHHERYDGTGYPQGLAGEDIPLAGRIVGLCDVYDAMTSQRVYKMPMPHQFVVDEIIHASGTHFDPRVVEAFLRVEGEFQKLSTKEQERADRHEMSVVALDAGGGGGAD